MMTVSNQRRCFGSLGRIDLLDDCFYHREDILQNKALTLFVMEFYSVVVLKLVSRLNNTWYFSRTIQSP